MKLPPGKKERVQVLVLIAIGVIVALYVVIQFGLLPFMASWDTTKKEHEEISAKLHKAGAQVRKAPGNRVSYTNTLALIEKISQTHVLQPVLGSFLLGVREDVDSRAQSSHAKVDFVRETGTVDVPGKRDGRDRQFRAYGVQVSGEASYEGVRDLIRKLEESNPYVCVSSILILAQPDTPQRHRFNLTIEWPIWKESETPRTPSAQKAAQTGSAGKKAPPKEPASE